MKRPIHLLTSAFVWCTAVAVGIAVASCGESRQTAFFWDHDVGNAPETNEPGFSPEPGPEAEPEPAFLVDVERWGVITGGALECVAATTNRNAAFLVFRDGDDRLLLELGPDFELRWDYAFQTIGTNALCAATPQNPDAEMEIASLNPFTGSLDVLGFREGGDNTTFRDVFPQGAFSYFIPATMMPFGADIFGVEGTVFIGAGDPGFGVITNTGLASLASGEQASAPLFNGAYLSPVVGSVLRRADVIAGFVDAQADELVVVQADLASGFSTPPLVARLSGFSLESISELYSRTHITTDAFGKVIVGIGDLVEVNDVSLDEVELSLRLESGATAESILVVDQALYVAATREDRAVVHRIDLDDPSGVGAVYRIRNVDSEAFDLKEGPDGTILFFWTEIGGGNPTTVDQLIPR